MFSAWDRWDVALLAVAGYIAMVSLSRLMALRRDQLIEQFRAEVETEHRRQALIAKQVKQAGATTAPPQAPDDKRGAA